MRSRCILMSKFRVNPGLALAVVGNVALIAYMHSLSWKSFHNVHHAGHEWQMEGTRGKRCLLLSYAAIEEQDDSSMVFASLPDGQSLNLYTGAVLLHPPLIEGVPTEEVENSLLPAGTGMYEVNLGQELPAVAMLRLKLEVGEPLTVQEEGTGAILAIFGGSDGEGGDAVDNWRKCRETLYPP